MKKPRADSKIFQLKPAQRAELDAWFREENVPYEEAQRRCLKKFKLKVSTNALSDYWKKHFLRDRFLKSVDLANALELPPDKFDAVTTQTLRQRFFEFAMEKDVDLDGLKTLGDIVTDNTKLQIRIKELELDERKVVLLEKKAKLADDAAKVMGDDSLNDEQKAARVREIFGIAGARPLHPTDAPASGGGVVAASEGSK